MISYYDVLLELVSFNERENLVPFRVVQFFVSFCVRLERTGDGNERVRRRAPSVNPQPWRMHLPNAPRGWKHSAKVASREPGRTSEVAKHLLDVFEQSPTRHAMSHIV
jgi:hypothetical protein